MSAYKWNLEADEATEILAADRYREEVLIQLYTLIEDQVNPVYFAFGEVPVIGIGIFLGNQGHTIRVLGNKATLAINAICASKVAGGIETLTSIEYRHALNYPPWVTDPQYPVWPAWPK